MSKLTLRSWISCVTVLVILLAVLLPTVMEVHGGWLSMTLILLLGIPHGATDHILFRQVRKDFDKGWLYRFFARYFLMMGLLFLSWMILPSLALIIFLAVSAYHFGQSEWHQINTGKSVKTVLYSLWGAFILAAPLLWNYTETSPIISSLIGTEINISAESQKFIPVILAASVITFLLALYLTYQITKRKFFKGLFSLFLLSYLFFTSSLLVGFAVYFVFWHSLESMRDQVSGLKSQMESYSVQKYISQILPFTALALGSLALFSWWSPHALMSEAWIGQFFMLVSIVTLPHSFLMDAFLEENLYSKREEAQEASEKGNPFAVQLNQPNGVVRQRKTAQASLNKRKRRVTIKD